tara:strand:+ start:1780 stop:2187 length:408 start_codon:yes stop_codon:yes gene_type:complete
LIGYVEKGKMPIRSRENLIGAWAFLIGIILAVIIGIFATLIGQKSISPGLLAILAILGLVVGYFVSEKDVQTFLIASVSLVVVSFAGIQGLVLSAALGQFDLNEFITTILGTLLLLFIPATIVVALKTVFSLAKR